ncbi:MAG: aminoglycoside phosphotransferase family protein, partial [Pseudonocardiaceae bacterium]
HRAEEIVTSAAARWAVRLDGFHDAGWTSVVAVGHRGGVQAVILKAFPGTERYLRERAALGHWAGEGVCRLLDADDDEQVLMLELVGGVPGGAPRPDDHLRRVADALSWLHRAAVAPDGPVPLLADYYAGQVLPRIERQAHHRGTVIGEHHVARALALGRELCSLGESGAMLHADLYAENVLFDQDQRAVFIDPHAKVGSPAFDWAFWCVYYMPDSGFADRIGLCRERVPALFDEVLAWSLTLVVDGALHYLETRDHPAMTAMQEVLRSPILAPVSGHARTDPAQAEDI